MPFRIVSVLVLVALGTTLSAVAGFVVPAPAGPQPPAPPVKYYDPLPR